MSEKNGSGSGGNGKSNGQPKREKRKRSGAPKGKTQVKRETPADDERVEFIISAHAMWATKGQIKAAFRARFGNVNAKTFEKYNSRARELMARSRQEDASEVTDQLVEFHKRVMREGNTGERVRSAQALADLLGVSKRLEISGVGGGPIEFEVGGALEVFRHPDLRDRARRLMSDVVKRIREDESLPGMPAPSSESNGSSANGNGRHP